MSQHYVKVVIGMTVIAAAVVYLLLSGTTAGTMYFLTVHEVPQQRPTVEPAVVEGAPPVPMRVTNWVIPLTQTADTTPPSATPYPRTGAADVYEDVVVKVAFSEPVTGVDATTLTLTDAQGTGVPASVAQIGDYTWGLFPHQVFLARGATYTARVAASVCDYATNCLGQDLTWRFTITDTPGGGQGDTSIPLGGSQPAAGAPPVTVGAKAPVGLPMDGQPQPLQPDAALPAVKQTARP